MLARVKLGKMLQELLHVIRLLRGWGVWVVRSHGMQYCPACTAQRFRIFGAAAMELGLRIHEAVISGVVHVKT